MPNTQPLPRALPEDAGVPSATVTAFLEALKTTGQEIHSLMLVRQGKVIAETWWKPYAPDLPHVLYSLSKSFTSTAVGLLVGEGKLDLDRPVVEILAEDSPARPSRYLRVMTVRHLLTMSTGHTTNTLEAEKAGKTKNWAKAVLRVKLEKQPGTLFFYNNGASYLLSAIVQKTSGQRMLDYLTPRLFEPLGITGAAWGRCPRGIDIGGFGLSLTTEDVAKFGLLYLNKGQWNGRRVLSEAWVEEATRAHVSTAPQQGDWAEGYGYQFWRCTHNAYRADGAFGQFCVVMPEQDAVLVTTAGAEDIQAVLNPLWDVLLPALKPAGAPVKAVKKHQAALRKMCASSRINPPAFNDHPNSAKVDGAVYVFEANALRFKSVSLSLAKGRLQVKLRGKRSATYRCGAGRWASGKAKSVEGRDRTSYPIRCAYTWTADGVLEAHVRVITTPHMTVYTFRFLPDGIEMAGRMNVSFGPPELSPIRGIRAPA